MPRCRDVGLSDVLIRVLCQVSAESCPAQAVIAEVSLATPVEVKRDAPLLQARRDRQTKTLPPITCTDMYMCTSPPPCAHTRKFNPSCGIWGLPFKTLIHGKTSQA